MEPIQYFRTPLSLAPKGVSTIAVVEDNPRRLAVDFELYTSGDLAFKRELIPMMIHNLMELTEVLNVGIQADREALRKTIHKITPTICMLNDTEFTGILEVLKVTERHEAVFQRNKGQFDVVCSAIIRELEEELRDWSEHDPHQRT